MRVVLFLRYYFYICIFILSLILFVYQPKLVLADTQTQSPFDSLGSQLEILFNNYQNAMEQNPIGLLTWEQANEIFPRHAEIEVIDVETGSRFTIQRIYGSLHADVVPSTTIDTQTLQSIVDGKYSWDRRAILIQLEGRYYAASMNSMPHGNGIEGNGYPGHFCIHFIDSKTHGGQAVCPQHQQQIQKAYEQGGQWLSFEEKWDVLMISEGDVPS